MSLNPEKLHVSCKEALENHRDFLPRRYTLTHSDATGDLYLTIDCNYNKKQLSSWYTKFMRDEVIAEWLGSGAQKELHVYLHVSGGLIFGGAKLRDRIFRYHMPLVLKAIVYGDKELFEKFPELLNSPIIVHFNSKNKRYDKIEEHGIIRDYSSIS